MTDTHEQFPQYMTHPHFKAATVDHWSQDKPPKLIASGTSMKFPPVTVQNQTQLDYHLAQGYQPSGKSDPRAFEAAKAVPLDAEPPQGFAEFPKMVGGKIVNDEAGEAARRAEMVEEEAERERAVLLAPTADPTDPGDAVVDLRRDVDEIKAGLALLLERATAPAPVAAPMTADSLRASLTARAEAAGVKVDGRWSLDKILAETEAAEGARAG